MRGGRQARRAGRVLLALTAFGLLAAASTVSADTGGTDVATDAGLEFVPVSPCAVFDTRTGTGEFAGKLAGGASRTLQVTGAVPAGQGGAACDAPPAEAVAVEINLVAIAPDAPGNLRIAAAGVTPQGGVVNYVPGANNSNALPVEVDDIGQVAVSSAVGGGAVHIRGVVLGYYTDMDATGLEFVPVAPCAVFDTRTATGGLAGKLSGGDSHTLQVTGSVPPAQGGAGCDAPPTEAVAVAVNLVALDAEGPGNLRIAAGGVTPQGGVVNYVPGADNANALPVEVDDTGHVTVSNVPGGADVDVRGVVLGYYTDANATGLELVPVLPCAVFDTRTATNGFAGKLSGGDSRTLHVTGSVPPAQGGAGCAAPPADAAAVAVNLVAVDSDGSGNLRIAAAGVTPEGGVVNYVEGANNSNALPVEVDDAGRVTVTNNGGGGGNVHVRGVALGYYVHATGCGAGSPTCGPVVVDDAFATTIGGANLAANVTTNDFLGAPEGAVASFGGGDLGGSVTDNAAGASVALAGGTLTLDADGTLTLAGPTTAGVSTFDYRVTNPVGSDDATVTITVQRAPTAADDAFVAATGATLDGDVFADNGSGADDRGEPAGDVTGFGDGDLGGDVDTNAPGDDVALGDGTVRLDADGTLSGTAPTTPGTYTFDYRLGNVAGSDTATVTISVARPPVAADDAFVTTAGVTLNGDVLADNGSGADDRGDPAGDVASFGDGDLGGAVTDNAAGTSVPLAGGTLTVDADGTLTLATPTDAGVHTFDYRLTSAAGSDDATVTITVNQAPAAVADAPADTSAPGDAWHTAFDAVLDSTGHATPSVLANDTLGFPTATLTHFGAGTLGGTVTDHTAGSTATVDGHSLTVGAGGHLLYTPKTGFTGLFTFSYRIANPGGTSDATVTIAVGARPVATADTYPHTLVGNVGIDTATATPFTVLGNDQGDDLAVNAGAATDGEVTLNTDGTFAFNPAAGFRNGNATFTYTVTNGFGTSAPATVTVPVGTQVIWFVDNATSACTTLAAGCGRLSNPLSTLAAFQAINDGVGTNPADNHHVFLYENTTAYAGPVTLRNGQRLIGQDATATLASLTGVTPPPHSPALPAMNSGNATRTTITSATTGVTLGSGNRIHGLTLGNATTALTGSAFGTLTVNDVTIDTNGRALDLANGTADMTLAATTSTGGTNNVRLASVAGTLTLGSGALSGSTAEALFIQGGTATLTYAGTITNTANRSVSISNKTAGTTTLSGQVTDTGTGINLASNTGATAAFTGGLDLSTGANPAFTATGGGVVTATQNNTSVVNTLATTTGTALHVENTTIGAAGLTFRSISVNGAVNGIRLNATGSSGGLTVTGNGGTCSSAAACTGGAIQNTSGPGISLTNTNAVSLTRMHVSGPADDGITGSTVTGFTLASSHLTGNGNAVFEAGLDFANLLGTASITGSTITGSADDNVVVRNTTGTLGLTISGNTISHNGTNGNDGVLLTATNSGNATLTVEDNTFTANKGDHVQATVANEANLTVTIRSNTMIGGHPQALGQGITLGTGLTHTGTFTYDIDGNTISGDGSALSGPISNAITVVGSGNTGSVAQGRIRNNTIGTAGQNLSCSAQGSGIAADAASRTTHTLEITGNTIRRCFDRGIFVNAVDGTGVTVNLTVTGNDVGDFNHAPGAVTAPREALYINVGATSSNQYGLPDDHVVCATIGGATAALHNTLSGGPDKTADLRLRMRINTRMNLPGYTGSHNNASGEVEAYLTPRNTAGSYLATTTAPTTNHGFHNVASCPTPP